MKTNILIFSIISLISIAALAQQAANPASSGNGYTPSGPYYSLPDGNSGIQGTILYDNTAMTPMSNSFTVVTFSANDGSDTVFTNASGFYGLTGLGAGNYRLAPGTFSQWGSVNVTDALMIARYSVGLENLTPFRALAADVNKSITVNAGDSYLIMRRWVGLISTFPSGDWLFSGPQQVDLSGQTVTANFMALCYGDVNGSWPFSVAARTNPSVTTVDAGSLDVKPGDILNIPVTMDIPAGINAMSLVLHYPASEMEILDVSLPLSGALWTAQNGQIRIAWMDLETASFTAGELLAGIRVRVNGNGGLRGDLRLGTGSGSEFAGSDGRVMEAVRLAAPVLKLKDGISSGQLTAVKVFPNPVISDAVMEITLEKAETIRLGLFDILGREVFGSTLELPAGTAAISLPLHDQPSGMYFYKLRGENTEQSGRISRK